MTKVHALVPIVGGFALIVGGMAALVCDVVDLRADPTEPRPIWVRYTSQATYNLKARSHWIFLSAICIFAPCLMVTAQWQASSLSDDDDDGDRAIVFHATLCALGGFLVALLPMGNALGTGIHMVTATCFAAFGINYAFQAWDLAVQLDKDTLASVRLILGLIGSVGAGLAIFSIYPATSGTEALEKHKQLVQTHHGAAQQDDSAGNLVVLADMPGFLTERQRTRARLGETALAVGQISIAITMAVTLLTGTAEAIEVQDTSDAVWIVGLVSSLGMTTLAAGFYVTKNWWYNTCQAKNNHDEDDGEEEETDNARNEKTKHAPDVVEENGEENPSPAAE